MDATGFQWVALVLGVAGFGVTWTMGVIGLTRAVENIKQDTTEKVAAASAKFSAKLDDLRAEFAVGQRTQDQHFGEVGFSVRQYISNVEKEMHEIEIWGRDNFVLKDDFVKATDRLEAAVKEMAASIKSDFKDLTKKIDERH